MHTTLPVVLIYFWINIPFQTHTDFPTHVTTPTPPFLNHETATKLDSYWKPGTWKEIGVSETLVFSIRYLQPLRVWAASFWRFRDHTRGRSTVGRTPLDKGSARGRDLYLTTLKTDNHVPGGIRTRNPSRRSAAVTRLRPLGHWDRRFDTLQTLKRQCTYNVTLKCVRESLFPRKSNKYYMCVCVCPDGSVWLAHLGSQYKQK